MIHAYAAMAQGQILQPYSYDPGPLQPDEVEIDVRYCGICHSDISMLDGDWGFSVYPLVPGHEVLGVLSAVGSAVKHLHVGQEVGLGWHAGYCKTCYQCHSGDHNLCSDAVATINVHKGGFADKVRAQDVSVIALPEGMLRPDIAPLLCGGITVFNPLIQFGIKPTDKVAVIGIGGLGQLALAFLQAWGCEVSAFSSSSKKRQDLLAMGCYKVLDSTDPASFSEHQASFDAIITTTNHSLDWNAIIGTLRPKGRLHFVGAVLEPLDIAAFGLIAAQRQISGSPVGSPATIADMLAFAQQHNISSQIEQYPMTRVQDAVERVRSGQAHYRVVLTNATATT